MEGTKIVWSSHLSNKTQGNEICK